MSNWYTLTLNEEREWNDLVDNCGESDIHFTTQYLKNFEDLIGGKATLFVNLSSNKKNYVLYPFFKRRINDLKRFSSLKQSFYDIISPWYFGGPLTFSNDNLKELFLSFQENFTKFSMDNNIITEFTRIHPILRTNKEFCKITNANYQYEVSYVDLSLSEETIWNNFKKSNRNAINSSKRKGVEILFLESKESLFSFFKLYSETMKRLQTDNFYLFDYSFFEKLYENLKNNMKIVVAQYNGIPISSTILLFKSGIVHYWLSGNDYNYRNFYPTNQLLYEAIKWAKLNNNKIFLLMGGSNKGLRTFKESFSNTSVGFYTLNKIHNHQLFKFINQLKDNKIKNKNSSYFPPYRE